MATAVIKNRLVHDAIECTCEDASWQQLDLFEYAELVSGMRERLIDRYLRGQLELRQLKTERAREEATRVMLKRRQISWDNLRGLVYRRDGGVCQVCGDAIPFEHYECGHVIDRFLGGIDCMCNLLCMCITCNRFKPPHKTREEYEAWIGTGHWHTEFDDLLQKRIAQEAT